MTPLDWAIVGIFCIASLVLGTLLTKQAGRTVESYFTSNHQLSWWLAGTSMAATAFSSDTPLLITGMVRRRGIWGIWEVQVLAISTMLSVFVFSKLWKRAQVLTEVEFVERRYSGRPAAFLRGVKAIYWGLIYNVFVMGAWPVTGLRKVLEETTGLSRDTAIISSVILAAIYTSCSGLWGVILTDLFQYVWAMLGAILLTVVAVRAAGGLCPLAQQLRHTPYLDIVPPVQFDHSGAWLNSPFGWFVGLMLVQWWAWKNTDGGGIIVQRLVSCKNERHAMLSVLWFNIAQYCLRSWPWILTALASIVLIPSEQLRVGTGAAAFIDHERAYPRLIMQLLPAGLKGVMVAAFFAAFLSTISTHLNWGASYLMNDWYKRFIRRHASERHYLAVSRMIPYGLAVGAMVVAFAITSVGDAFTLILNITAGIGPVYLLRWLWWRVKAWGGIAAMVARLPLLAIRSSVIAHLGWPPGTLINLLFMVLGTALVWVPVTWLTPPVDRSTLKRFYATVRPPGLWRPVALAAKPEPWGWSLLQWVISTVALFATTMGPLQLLLCRARAGLWWCGVAVAGWVMVWMTLNREPARSR